MTRGQLSVYDIDSQVLMRFSDQLLQHGGLSLADVPLLSFAPSRLLTQDDSAKVFISLKQSPKIRVQKKDPAKSRVKNRDYPDEEIIQESDLRSPGLSTDLATSCMQ